MNSTHNEQKTAVAKRFIGTLNNKIYKYMTVNSENAYFNVLNDIVDECNNMYHQTIKMKPTDIKSDSFSEYNEKYNEKDPKFNVGDPVRISKYKSIFFQGYAINWGKETFFCK